MKSVKSTAMEATTVEPASESRRGRGRRQHAEGCGCEQSQKRLSKHSPSSSMHLPGVSSREATAFHAPKPCRPEEVAVRVTTVHDLIVMNAYSAVSTRKHRPSTAATTASRMPRCTDRRCRGRPAESWWQS